MKKGELLKIWIATQIFCTICFGIMIIYSSYVNSTYLKYPTVKGIVIDTWTVSQPGIEGADREYYGKVQYEYNNEMYIVTMRDIKHRHKNMEVLVYVNPDNPEDAESSIRIGYNKSAIKIEVPAMILLPAGITAMVWFLSKKKNKKLQ